MKLKKVDRNTLLWGVSLLFFYFFDAMDKFSRSLGENKYAFVIRMISITIMIIVMVLQPNVLLKNKRALYFICLLFSVTIGLLFSGLYYNDDFGLTLYVLIRYLSFIIFLYFLLHCFQSNDFGSNGFFFILKIIVYIFLINSLLAWLGYFFELNIFRTYGHIQNLDEGWIDQRFGYDGLLLEQNNATYFYIIGFVCTYWLYKYKKLNAIFVMFGFISCFIVGTKSLYAAIGLISVLLLVKSRKMRILLGGVSLFILILYITLNSEIFSLFNYNTLNSILSGRLNNFTLHISPLISKFGFSEYIFGIQGAEPSKYLVEMEVVDLMVFFGVVGTVLYIFILAKECVYIARNSQLIISKVTIILILLVSFFSGHLFYDPVSSFYFATLLLVVALNNNMKLNN